MRKFKLLFKKIRSKNEEKAYVKKAGKLSSAPASHHPKENSVAENREPERCISGTEQNRPRRDDGECEARSVSCVEGGTESGCSEYEADHSETLESLMKSVETAYQLLKDDQASSTKEGQLSYSPEITSIARQDECRDDNLAAECAADKSSPHSRLADGTMLGCVRREGAQLSLLFADEKGLESIYIQLPQSGTKEVGKDASIQKMNACAISVSLEEAVLSEATSIESISSTEEEHAHKMVLFDGLNQILKEEEDLKAPLLLAYFQSVQQILDMENIDLYVLECSTGEDDSVELESESESDISELSIHSAHNDEVSISCLVNIARGFAQPVEPEGFVQQVEPEELVQQVEPEEVTHPVEPEELTQPVETEAVAMFSDPEVQMTLCEVSSKSSHLTGERTRDLQSKREKGEVPELRSAMRALPMFFEHEGPPVGALIELFESSARGERTTAPTLASLCNWTNSPYPENCIEEPRNDNHASRKTYDRSKHDYEHHQVHESAAESTRSAIDGRRFDILETECSTNRGEDNCKSPDSEVRVTRVTGDDSHMHHCSETSSGKTSIDTLSEVSTNKSSILGQYLDGGSIPTQAQTERNREDATQHQDVRTKNRLEVKEGLGRTAFVFHSDDEGYESVLDYSESEEDGNESTLDSNSDLLTEGGTDGGDNTVTDRVNTDTKSAGGNAVGPADEMLPAKIESTEESTDAPDDERLDDEVSEMMSSMAFHSYVPIGSMLMLSTDIRTTQDDASGFQPYKRHLEVSDEPAEIKVEKDISPSSAHEHNLQSAPDRTMIYLNVPDDELILESKASLPNDEEYDEGPSDEESSLPIRAERSSHHSRLCAGVQNGPKLDAQNNQAEPLDPPLIQVLTPVYLPAPSIRRVTFIAPTMDEATSHPPAGKNSPPMPSDDFRYWFTKREEVAYEGDVNSASGSEDEGYIGPTDQRDERSQRSPDVSSVSRTPARQTKPSITINQPTKSLSPLKSVLKAPSPSQAIVVETEKIECKRGSRRARLAEIRRARIQEASRAQVPNKYGRASVGSRKVPAPFLC